LAQSSNTANLFLARLAEHDQKALFPNLEVVDLEQHAVLHDVGDPLRAVYFPHSGIISIVVHLRSGDMIEAGTVGLDGMIGGGAGFGEAVAVNRAVVQVAGHASVAAAYDLRAVADGSPTLRNQLFVQQQFLLAQAQQCAACNGTHPIERRLARWLLRCRDIAKRDDLPLTQEFVAEMLGVRRSSVSIVANALQRAGLIETRRGIFRLLDLDGLRASACECYEAVNDLSERLLGHRPER
jgi:CRP-like cAMP-binding protein